MERGRCPRELYSMIFKPLVTANYNSAPITDKKNSHFSRDFMHIFIYLKVHYIHNPNEKRERKRKYALKYM